MDKGSYWGYEQQGNGQLQSVQSFHNALPTHSTHKMQPLDTAFFGTSKTFYGQEIEKWLRSNPGRCVTLYQIGGLFGNTSKLQQERQRLMAAGRQAFSVVTWPSSDHMISLWHQGTQMLLLWNVLLWWILAISHYSILLIFRRSLLLRLSDHQVSAMCQAWTESKPLWWNSKENKGLT
jgi:hypothetical protein